MSDAGVVLAVAVPALLAWDGFRRWLGSRDTLKATRDELDAAKAYIQATKDAMTADLAEMADRVEELERAALGS